MSVLIIIFIATLFFLLRRLAQVEALGLFPWSFFFRFSHRFLSLIFLGIGFKLVSDSGQFVEPGYPNRRRERGLLQPAGPKSFPEFSPAQEPCQRERTSLFKRPVFDEQSGRNSSLGIHIGFYNDTAGILFCVSLQVFHIGQIKATSEVPARLLPF